MFHHPTSIFFVKSFLTLLTVALGHCRCTFHLRCKNVSLEVPLPLTLFSAIAIHLMMTSFMHFMHVSMFQCFKLVEFGSELVALPRCGAAHLEVCPPKGQPWLPRLIHLSPPHLPIAANGASKMTSGSRWRIGESRKNLCQEDIRGHGEGNGNYCEEGKAGRESRKGNASWGQFPRRAHRRRS